MRSSRNVIRILGVTLCGWTFSSALADTESNKFFRAYYLETALDQYANALPLYREVIADPTVKDEIKAQARERLAGCEEEVAAADLASLMPPTTLAYMEFRRPGEQMSQLLGQLGLLAADVAPAAKATGPQVTISPAFIRELLGIRGLAVALTGIDALKQKPMGVAVLHPGNLEVIRAMLETALPVAGKRVEPVAGFETFTIEDQAVATLTARLIIVGTDRGQVEGVIRRLRGKEKTSLTNSDQLAALMKDRGDSMFFLAVNAKPVMPMLNALMLAAGAASPEAAMAQQILDVNALNAVVIRGGVTAEGVAGDVMLRLDKGHRNLVYNFVRMPPLPPDALKAIPSGAAAVAAFALNPATTAEKVNATSGSAKPYVSFMDLGREFFGNLTQATLVLLPPSEEAGTAAGKIPDVLITLSANDPAKTSALWTQFMGLASVASGGGTMEGTVSDVDGQSVRTFAMPEGITLHTRLAGSDFIVTSTARAMRQSISAGKGGASIAGDASFGDDIQALAPSTTAILAIHPGRCAKVARRFAPADEAAEIEPFIDLLQHTVVTMSVDHSEETWHAGLRIKGLPNVGPMVSQLIQQARVEEEEQERLEGLMRGKKWDAAISAIDERLAKEPRNKALLRRKFDVLATGKNDTAGAATLGAELCAEHLGGATALNNFAWSLLTEEKYDGAFAELARNCAEKSNTLSAFGEWRFLDTLALALFETGNVSRAIEVQKQAIEQFNGSGLGEMKKTLARFEEKARADQLAQMPGS